MEYLEKQNLKISVCMAAYNGAKYIGDQIESIIKQLDKDDEIIISDDGSTDNTIEIINAYEDPRIKLFKNSFHNYIRNFEFAISKANGDIIFLSDQDDVWLDNKVTIMSRLLTNYDLVCSNCSIVDANLNLIKDTIDSVEVNKRNGFFTNLLHNHYIGCCMAFKKELVNRILPFPKGLITHDTWIGLNAELYGRPIFIDDKLILYRRHGNNTSNTTEGSTLNFVEKINYRNVILWGLIKSCCKSVFSNHK